MGMEGIQAGDPIVEEESLGPKRCVHDKVGRRAR